LLRVIQPRERTTVRQRQTLDVEQDRSRDQRAREAPPSRLVRSCDEATAELTIEGEELATRRP
jgi:hypothetical protein